MPETPTVPGEAVREPARRASFLWVLPLLALGLSVFLLSRGLVGGGTGITVQAVDGHGIRVGDAVRHLGIQVGTVEEVGLGATLEGVVLDIVLEPGAEPLAREGSRFWIVRPHLALDSIQGLETIVGARYVAVVPGPTEGARRSDFVALEEPPVEESVEPGGLEVVLEAPARFGLMPGAPVEYRQVRVGTVLAVGLASDASSVEVRAYVRPPFVELIRERTVFWESGGIEIDLSLTGGLDVGLESARSILVGGVQFATPPDAGAAVRTGHRFPLAADAEAEWIDWTPNLPVGGELIPPGVPLPALHRARLSWREGRLLKRERERVGWLLRVAGGVIGPTDLVTVPDDALDEFANLEVAGAAVPLGPGLARTDLGKGLSRLALATGSGSAPEPATRRAEGAEDVVLVREAGAQPLALDEARLEALGEGEFRIDGAVGLDPGWHGAAALARVDGALVGLLRIDGSEARIAPLP